MLPSPKISQQPSDSPQVKLERFLVCGLGIIGQHCIAVLKEYGVAVSAIDQVQPQNWETPEVPHLLDDLVIGDCRQPNVLEQAKIRQCRSILLVTANERVNIEAAFAARLLNPQIRLIVRSAKQNLNELLKQELENFLAFEPTELSASAFAVSALGAETIGYFNLEGHLLRVVKRQLQVGEHWCQRRVDELNSGNRRVLSHTCGPASLPKQFAQWELDATVQAGDTVVYIETIDRQIHQPATAVLRQGRQLWQRIVRGISWKKLKQKGYRFWQNYKNQNQIRRVATIYLVTVFCLWLCGAILYRLYYPDIGIAEALYAPIILLLGGYGDLFGSVKFGSQPAPAEHMPWWLRLFSLGLTLAGEAFVGVLYALITDTLIAARFKFFTNRPSVPKQDHVVLIGLERLGQRVAALLQDLNQPLVGITSTALDEGTLPQMPLIVGNIGSDIAKALAKVNLSRAKSIIVVTDDDMVNLEIGLMAHAANPTSNLVIRTYEQNFSDNVARLFPYAQVLCGSALSAEVFAAAAFGENVLSLFHFNHQTVLVTEYNVEVGDTLNGFLLAEFAYGYGVVPILHQKNPHEPPKLMPSEDRRLDLGDRLVVLAMSSSLQRIERGEMAPRLWQVQIKKVLARDAVFEGAQAIALVSGCSIGMARELMNHLPGLVQFPLYKHQAQRLVCLLSQAQVRARLLSIVEDNHVERNTSSNRR